MAQIFPFQPYQYSPAAGPLENLVTQPYDKISPEMQARYLSLSPYNLVRIILGEHRESDHAGDNVYTRSAQLLQDWIARKILIRETGPRLFAYFQSFSDPDTDERLVRKGLIGLGDVEDYSAGIVHRHEQTLSGPKKDRLELLRHTRAHFGQIFMLYPDPQGQIDGILDDISQSPPAGSITDEYGARHELWKISDPAPIAQLQQLMSDKKLLIADGHHRYETALTFRNENPGLPGADKVMMTFVNMYSEGLRILPTHRLVSGLENFRPEQFLARAAEIFEVRPINSLDELKRAWADPANASRTCIGAAIEERLYLLQQRAPSRELDVNVLHGVVLEQLLGVNQAAVRDEKHVRYVRGLQVAMDALRQGIAQIAFLLKPAAVEDVARISFAGGVMPQKSTDFYPKLLSGLTIYKIDP